MTTAHRSGGPEAAGRAGRTTPRAGPSTARVGFAPGPLTASLLVLVVAGLSGCSLAVLERTPCDASSQCHDAFGRGWVCGEGGYCSEEPLPARCDLPTVDTVEVSDLDDEPLWLGSIFDQSESMPRVRAARLAVLEVNRRDGLGGQRVRLIECNNDPNVDDDGLQPAAATELLTEHLVEAQGVHAIIGPSTSTNTEIAYNVAAPKGALLFTPSASSPALTALDGVTASDADPGLLWRTAPPDTLQGRVMALEFIAAGLEHPGIVYQVGAYGEGLSQVFQQSFVGGSRQVGIYPFEDTTDLSTAVVQASAVGHDSMLVISSAIGDVSGFLNAAGGVAGEPYAGLPIYLTDGGFDSQLFDGTRGAPGEDLWGQIRGTVPATPSGIAFDIFVAAYRAEFAGENPEGFAFTAHAYDATWLTLVGSAWAKAQEGAITGLNTARGLRRVSDPGFGEPLDLGPNAWNELQAELVAGNTVDLQGASGALDYDPETGETTAPTEVWSINVAEEEFEILYCVDLSPSPSPECCTDPTSGGCG